MEEETSNEVDIDTELSALFDEIEAREPEQLDIEGVAETQEAKAERERDEKGRFKAKETEETQETPEVPKEEQAAQPTEQEAPKTEEAEAPTEEGTPLETETPVMRPPSTWNAEGKAKFNELPDWAKQQIIKREDDIGKGIHQYREAAQEGARIKDIINPYMPMIQAEGGSVEGAIQSLFNTAYQLRTGTPQQKGALIKEMARIYGAEIPDGEQAPVDRS